MKRFIVIILLMLCFFSFVYAEEYINVEGKILEFETYDKSLEGIYFFIKDYFLKLYHYQSVDSLIKENYKLANEHQILKKDYIVNEEDITVLRENYHQIIRRLDRIKNYFLQEEEKIYRLASAYLKEDIRSYEDLLKYKDSIIKAFDAFNMEGMKKQVIDGGVYYSKNGTLDGKVLYIYDSGLEKICFYESNNIIGTQYIKTADHIKKNTRYQMITDNKLSLYFSLDTHNKYLIINYMNENFPSIRFEFDKDMVYTSKTYYNDVLYSIQYSVNDFSEVFSRRGSSSPFNPVAIYYENGERYIAPIGNKGIGYKYFTDEVECLANFDEYYLSKDTDILYFDKNGMVSFKLDDEIKAISKKRNELKKIKSIYKYIAKKISYYSLNDEKKKILSHTGYGAYKYHAAVCDGYAEYFKYILDYMNIENKIVYGEVDEDGKFENTINHAWNMIKINGEYRHFDITWDDHDYLGRVNYDYFNKTEEAISKTHRAVYNNDK